jgi:hypothetical protein
MATATGPVRQNSAPRLKSAAVDAASEKADAMIPACKRARIQRRQTAS